GSTPSTDWFDVSAAEWVEDAGDLVIDQVARVGDARSDSGTAGLGEGVGARVVPGSVRWLRDATGAVHRVRFALRLDASEHVVGFGERFDAVDQRSKSLDAVVFEQYKSQGEHGRTYLPMPFAHVVGGEGWGFHVRTSRRSWYDVAASSPDAVVVEVALGGADRERL